MSSSLPDDQTFADDEPDFAESDILPDEIAPDDEIPFDDASEDAAPSPVAPPKTAWRNAIIGVALLIWMAVAFKAWQLRSRPAPAARSAPVASQTRAAPRATEAPRAHRTAVRRLAAPAKRRLANTRPRPKSAPHHAAEPKRIIILGRGAVVEDDKSIIRIRD